MGKSKRQLADEAYRRVVELADAQLDITEQIAQEEEEAKGPPPAIDAWDKCPSCGREQGLARGWTVNREKLGVVLCGNCGRSFTIPYGAWCILVDQLAAFAEQQRAKLAPLPKADAGQKRQRWGGG